MAYREPGAPLVVPSVLLLKVDHYTALIRYEGGRYLLQDPTFGNDTWATHDALEAEASGYFLIPPGELPSGWRAVDAQEGGRIWRKGNVNGPEPGPHGPCDPSARLNSGQFTVQAWRASSFSFDESVPVPVVRKKVKKSGWVLILFDPDRTRLAVI